MQKCFCKPKLVTSSIRVSSIVLILFLLLSVNSNIHAQDVPTPPSDSPALTASTAIGDIRSRSLDDVFAETQISEWKQEGWAGRDVRVGVIDLSFGRLSQFETSNEINVLVPGEKGEQQGIPADYSTDVDPHGTDVLQIIHEIAPNAELYACRYSDFASFDECVSFMEKSHVRIINHSAGMLQTSLDGTGQWTVRADEAADNFDILWINATGNFANGIIDNTFLPNEEGWHQFIEAGELNTAICVPGLEDVSESTRRRVMLTWTDSANFSAENLDLSVTIEAVEDCSPGAPRLGDPRTSLQIQNGQIPPVDWIDQENATQAFRIYLGSPINSSDGAVLIGEALRYRLMIEFSELPDQVPTGALLAPSDGSDVISVGAIQVNDVATYSSRGLTDSGIDKPDMVAPGEIELPDGRNFIGTSAAAPVVAGAAALIWEAETFESTSDDIREKLLEDSVIPDPTNRVEYGNGRLNLPEAPIRINGGSINVTIPYAEDFTRYSQQSPIIDWIDENSGWQVRTVSGEDLLIGMGNADRTLEVMGQQDPEWLVSDNLVISFDFRIDSGAQGLRMVFRYNEENGYHVLGLLPGQIYLRRDDRGQDTNPVDDLQREGDFERGLQDAPIETGQFYHVQLWISGDVVHLNLGNNIFMRATDQFSPPLPRGGRILFQPMDAQREVFIDNLMIRSADSASIRFNGNSLGRWETNNEEDTALDDENSVDGTDYLQLRGSVLTASLENPLKNMRVSCDMQRVRGSFSMTLRESDTGALRLDYGDDALLRIQNLDANGSKVWESDPIQNFMGSNWDHVIIELIDSNVSIWRDGVHYYLGTIEGGETMQPGGMSFSTSPQSILHVDNCLIIPLEE